VYNLTRVRLDLGTNELTCNPRFPSCHPTNIVKVQKKLLTFIEIIMISWKISRRILHTGRMSTSTEVCLSLLFIMGPYGRKHIKLFTDLNMNLLLENENVIGSLYICVGFIYMLPLADMTKRAI